MPNVTLTNGDVFTFYTRVPTGGGQFPDRLQVRMSTNGASTDVGTSNTSTGDFSTLLLDINPTYSTTVYPEVWTQFTITISGLAILHPVALPSDISLKTADRTVLIQIL